MAARPSQLSLCTLGQLGLADGWGVVQIGAVAVVPLDMHFSGRDGGRDVITYHLGTTGFIACTEPVRRWPTSVWTEVGIVHSHSLGCPLWRWLRVTETNGIASNLVGKDYAENVRHTQHIPQLH
jgi:hypothetical protein